MSKFKDPNINISKVYTKSGDKGKTYLIGGEKVSKDDIRVIAYGDVDELNVHIGICSNFLKNIPNSKDFSYFIERLVSIQNELFNLGTVLAATGSEMSADLPRVTQDDIKNLEEDIDKIEDIIKTAAKKHGVKVDDIENYFDNELIKKRRKNGSCNKNTQRYKNSNRQRNCWW